MVVGVDESRQHEHPVAAELLGTGVLAAQGSSLADGRDDPVADRDGTARQRRDVRGCEQEIAVDQQFGHVPGR